MDRYEFEVDKNVKTDEAISSHLDEQAWLIKDLLYGQKGDKMRKISSG